MTQRGREPYTETFSVRLKPTDFQEFEERARKRGVGRSILGREIIMAWLDTQRDADHRRETGKPNDDDPPA